MWVEFCHLGGAYFSRTHTCKYYTRFWGRTQTDAGSYVSSSFFLERRYFFSASDPSRRGVHRKMLETLLRGVRGAREGTAGSDADAPGDHGRLVGRVG